MTDRLRIQAQQMEPFDLLSEGECLRRMMFGVHRVVWDGFEHHEEVGIEAEVGPMRMVEIETGIPDWPFARCPEWGEMTRRWFDFEEMVTVLRHWLPT
jgi:hypothetical protein